MSASRTIVTTAVALGLVSLLGCDKPPEAEMQAARQAVMTAENAQAEKYAAREYRALSDSLRAVAVEVQHQQARYLPSYQEARTSLARIDTLAAQVAETARANKRAMRAATETVLGQAAAAVDSAATLLAAAPRGKGTQQDIAAFEAQLQQLRGKLAPAQGQFMQEQFTEARRSAQAVIDETVALQAELRQAINRYDQLRGARGRRSN